MPGTNDYWVFFQDVKGHWKYINRLYVTIKVIDSELKVLECQHSWQDKSQGSWCMLLSPSIAHIYMYQCCQCEIKAWWENTRSYRYNKITVPLSNKTIQLYLLRIKWLKLTVYHYSNNTAWEMKKKSRTDIIKGSSS